MSENYKTKKIGVTALCRVSAKGGEGIYLYVPKNFAEVYGVMAADYAEVRFGSLFFKVADEPAPEESKVVDLRCKSRKVQDKTQDLDGEDAFQRGELPNE